MVEQVVRRSAKPGAVAVLVLLAAAWGVVRAQTGAAEEGRKLSLAECLRTALSNNLDLVAARKDPAIAEKGVVIEDAGFDPALQSSPSHSESKQEITNLFSFTERKSDRGNLAVEQSLEFGASYTADLGFSRNEAQGPFVFTDSSYQAQMTLTFNLPLLGNSRSGPAGRTATTERLELARRDLDISRDQLRIEAHRVLEQVEVAYWNVVAGREALRIAHLSLGRAEDLLALNRKKVEVGTLAPIEITQAQAGVAAQEEGVIVAETDLGNAQDELRRLLALPKDDPLWDQPLIPSDQPAFEEQVIDLERATGVALEHRPELSSARQQLTKDELSERVARRKVRPGLGLTAQLTPSGNDFSTTIDPQASPPTVNVVSDGGLNSAFEEIPKLENYDWSLGLDFRYPIGNRAAKAGYAVSTLNREKSQVNLLNQEQTIRVDVRRAVRGVESATKRVQAARENVRLQTEKLHAEEKKFENGLSTSFEVLTFQNDLADAELSQVRATLDYAKALTALERAKGTLLEARGLTLAP